MEPSDDIVLFLGAGASLDAPANGPLFGAVRHAIVRWAGLRQPRGEAQWLLHEHVIPEVFLKFAHDCGYELNEPLAALVEGRGAPGAGPNAVHRLAAEVIAAGGRVWTTNWDTWVERASGTPLVAVDGTDPDAATAPLVKLHGTATDPSSLRFTSSQILHPSPASVRESLVHAVQGRRLMVVGYGGADLDIFEALRAGIGASAATYWFEGLRGDRLDDLRTSYVRWRFGLDSVIDPTDALPDDGAHLVWSGEGTAAATPSQAVLLALSRPTTTTDDPQERHRRVEEHLGAPPRPRPSRPDRLLFRAEVRERRGRRTAALATRAALVVVGPPNARKRSGRAIGHLTLLRARRLRPVASWLATRLARDPDRKAFIRAQRGAVEPDLVSARAVADGSTTATIDRTLDLASNARWAGDLRLAERLARQGLQRALESDRATSDHSGPDRDWPERVSRAAFEVAQALLWSGQLHAADDLCRTGLMRAAGAKWAAWEYTVRAGVRMAADDLQQADAQLAAAITMLRAEGFGVQVSTIWTERAVVARRRGDLDQAREHLRRARRVPDLGVGSQAFILAEEAEQSLARGDVSSAHDRLRQLSTSVLPLWAALGELRLAELDVEPERHGAAAEQAFVAAGCHWGALRAARTTGSRPEDEIRAEALSLGPPAAYLPGGPVAF